VVTRQSSDSGIGLVTQWSRVWAPATMLSSNNLGQVVHTHVPLSQNSIIWYWPMGGNAHWLGRSICQLAEWSTRQKWSYPDESTHTVSWDLPTTACNHFPTTPTARVDVETLRQTCICRWSLQVDLVDKLTFCIAEISHQRSVMLVSWQWIDSGREDG